MSTKSAKKAPAKPAAKKDAKPPKSAPAGTPEVKPVTPSSPPAEILAAIERLEDEASDHHDQAAGKYAHAKFMRETWLPKPAPKPEPEPKVCRLWHVSGAGYKNRKVEAFGAEEAVREFCALLLTGGNLAEIGNGVVNANRSVDFVATGIGFGTHLVTVEEVK